MRWFSALLVLALAGFPILAQVAAVDAPIDSAAGPRPPLPGPPVLAPVAPVDAPIVFAPVSNLVAPDVGSPESTVRLEVDYLYWFLRGMSVPPLLTTGTAGPSGSVGAVGDPGTTILYGNGTLHSRFDRTIGVQLRGRAWLDDEQTFGIHGTAFFLERSSSNFTLANGAVSPLARPYVNALTGLQQTELIGGNIPGIGPGLGGFNAYSRTELFGQDLNAMLALIRTDTIHLSALMGLRCLEMRDRLDITATTQFGPNLNSVVGQDDRINTYNKFFGMQVGLLGDVQLLDRLSLTAKGTFALGDNLEEIKNSGDTIIDTPATGRVVEPYGLYVLPSNSGSFHQSQGFNTVWEISLTLNWEVTRWLVARAGYSFLGWDKPIRAGQQITPIDLTQLPAGAAPGLAYPNFPGQGQWFWAQGIQCGLEFRW